MTELNKNPCAEGLTSECFKVFPAWAKRALFLRLLYLLLPVEITSKLPGIFRLPFFFQGPVFPPGWQPGDPPPDGAFIPTETIFPPGWLFGDPWPEGIFIWEPFDPPPGLDLKDGILVTPGTTFPDGWQPGDELPDGAFDLTDLSDITDASALGLLNYIYPWGWGDSRPRKGPSYDYFFYEHFTSIVANDWALTPPVSNGDLYILGSSLIFNTTAIVIGTARATQSDRVIKEDFDILFDLWYTAGSRYIYFEFFTGTYRIQIYWDNPDAVRIRDVSDLQPYSCTDFITHTDYWKIEVRGNQIKLYQSPWPLKTDWNQIGVTLTLAESTSFPGRLTWFFWDSTTVWIDFLTIDDGSGVVTIT